LNGLHYEADVLVFHESRTVQVWWDPLDLNEVIVFHTDGRELCRAELVTPFVLGDAESMAMWTTRRERRSALRRATKQFVHVLGHAQPEDQARVLARIEGIAKSPRPSREASPVKSDEGTALAGEVLLETLHRVIDAGRPHGRAQSEVTQSGHRAGLCIFGVPGDLLAKRGD